MVSLCVLNLLQLHSCWLLPWGYVDNHSGLRKEFPQNRCCPRIPCSYGNKPTKKEKRHGDWGKYRDGAYGHSFLSFVVNFSSPESGMKWKNLRNKIFRQTFKWKQTNTLEAHLFSVALKQRIAGLRAFQKFHFISKSKPFSGQRWLQLFFPFVVVLT